MLVFKANRAEAIEQAGVKGWLIEFREKAIDSIGSGDDAHVLLQALSCGYRVSLSDTRLYSAFQTSGLAHMVAVSGAHLVIVTSLISSLLKALRAPRRPSILVLVMMMAAYTVMAGMPLSCIRAAIMSSVGILALLGKRRPSSLNALGIVVFCMISTTPHAAVSSSFALSVLATTGIVVFGPLFEMLAESISNNMPKSLAQALALSASASLLAQWYASALFKTLPLISPIANVICAPLLPICCSCGLVASIFGAFGLPFAPFLLKVSSVIADAFIAIVRFFADVPYAAMPVSIEPATALITASLCGTFIWVVWERLFDRSFLALTAFSAFTLVVALWLKPLPDSIIMLDVGQGDSFLVRSEGHTMLVDTGNQDRKLLDQLARCRIAHLDCVVITHADDDHCGSLDALQRAVDVDTILIAEGLIHCDDEKCEELMTQAFATSEKVAGLRVHDSFNIGKFKSSVLWPERIDDNGGNADSIVLYLAYDGNEDGHDDLSALFLGDAEHEQLEEIIKENALEKIDILKVAHHGSRNAMKLDQAELLNPKIALIGVGEGNRYGHPTDEILEMLKSIDCTVLRSDLDGGVSIEPMEGKVILRKL